MHSPATEKWPSGGTAGEWRWRSPQGWNAGRSLFRMLKLCGQRHRTDRPGTLPQREVWISLHCAILGLRKFLVRAEHL